MTDKMSFEKLRELEKKATSGPWFYDEENCNVYSEHCKGTTAWSPAFGRQEAEGCDITEGPVSCEGCDDQEFIAAARTAVPELLEKLDRCRDALKFYGSKKSWPKYPQHSSGSPWSYDKIDWSDVNENDYYGGEVARKCLKEVFDD